MTERDEGSRERRAQQRMHAKALEIDQVHTDSKVFEMVSKRCLRSFLMCMSKTSLWLQEVTIVHFHKIIPSLFTTEAWRLDWVCFYVLFLVVLNL